MGMSVRNHISPDFIFSAFLSARCAYDLRDRNGLKEDDKFIRYQGYAINAVINSVTFLEASINAFLLEVRDFNTEKVPDTLGLRNVDTNILNAIRNAIKQDESCASNKYKRWDYKEIKEKYDMALIQPFVEPFDDSQGVSQNINILVGFRNYLVHHKVHTQDFPEQNEIAQEKLVRQLNNKFQLHPLYEEDLFACAFPNSHLSHECARWSASTAKKFVEEFYQKFTIPAPHQNQKYEYLFELWN